MNLRTARLKPLAFGILLAALVATIGGPLIVSAQQQVTGLSLTETPLLREFSADPGQTLTGSLEITNNAEIAVQLTPQIKDFTASTDPESGAPTINEESGPDGQSLSDWTTFKTATFEIEPKATKVLEYTIVVPADAEAGGHYGVILVGTENPTVTTTTGVSVSGEVGSLVFVTVAGDVRADGKLLDFKVDKLVYLDAPVKFLTSVQNSGNVHFKPKGAIDINNGSFQTSLSLNKEEGSILPDSTRNFHATLEESPLGFGKYTATLDGTLVAPSGVTIPLKATTSFWIVPLNSILIALLVLVILWMLLKSGRRPQAPQQTVPAQPSPAPTPAPSAPTPKSVTPPPAQ